MLPRVVAILRALTRSPGAPFRERLASLAMILSLLGKSRRDRDPRRRDPLARSRQALAGDGERLRLLEDAVRQEIERVVKSASSSGEK